MVEVDGDISMESVPENDAKEVGAMGVNEDGDKALELERAGSPQSLATVEPLRRKESLADGELEGVQEPERPTQEKSLPEQSRTQDATRILSSTRRHRRHPRLPISPLHTVTSASMMVEMP